MRRAKASQITHRRTIGNGLRGPQNAPPFPNATPSSPFRHTPACPDFALHFKVHVQPVSGAATACSWPRYAPVAVTAGIWYACTFGAGTGTGTVAAHGLTHGTGRWKLGEGGTQGCVEANTGTAGGETHLALQHGVHKLTEVVSGEWDLMRNRCGFNLTLTKVSSLRLCACTYPSPSICACQDFLGLDVSAGLYNLPEK